MADITLRDGREITFDLEKVTYKQWKGIWSGTESDEETDATVARCAGITVEELHDLPQPDWRAVMFALHKKGTQPLSSPNSQRAST